MAHLVVTLPRPVSPGHEVMRDETQWNAIVAEAGPELATRYMLEGVGRYNLYRVERPHVSEDDKTHL
jgi:hypothetical protein